MINVLPKKHCRLIKLFKRGTHNRAGCESQDRMVLTSGCSDLSEEKEERRGSKKSSSQPTKNSISEQIELTLEIRKRRHRHGVIQHQTATST